jgi:hypothetical protein
MSENGCIGLQCYDNEKTKEIYETDFSEYCPGFDVYPTVLGHKERVIAIGDIHGDMNLGINFLKAAKVIEEVCPKKEFSGKKIKEYKYNIILDQTDTKIDELKRSSGEKTYNEVIDHLKNQIELVYRYYEIDSNFYVKIVQEDNNPNKNPNICKTDTNDNNRWFKWIGRDTHVVQVGDQIDRCRPYNNNKCINKSTTINDEDSDLEIMLFYDSLDKIAMKKKGRVFSLLGNHEIMNVMGDMRYVSHKGLREYSPEPKNIEDGLNKRTDNFKTIISRKMACTRSTVLVIGDYLFVHGGIASKLAYKYNLIEVNSIIRKFLNGSLLKHVDLGKLLNSSKFSPLWYRQLAYIPPDVNKRQHNDCKNIFQPILTELNEKNFKSSISNEPSIQIKGMVIGHTPQFTVFGTGITTACDNTLIRADIGASVAFDVFSDDIKSRFPHIDIDKSRLPQVVEITTNLKTKQSTVKILPNRLGKLFM